MESQRNRILVAAMILFQRHGFGGTTVPAVAAEAKVAVGSIYRYFPSKESLVNCLYVTWKDKFLAELRGASEALPSGHEGYLLLWRNLVRFVRKFPKQFLFLEAHHHAPYLDAESLSKGREVMSFVVGFVVEAQRLKEIVPLDPSLVVAIVFGPVVELLKYQEHSGVLLSDEAFEAVGTQLWLALHCYSGS